MSGRNFAILLVGIGIVAFIALRPRPYSIGDKIDNFTLGSVQGDQIRLTDFRGKVLFIEFFSTWCPYCKQAYPRTVEWSEVNKDKPNVAFLKISCGEEYAVVKAFAENNISNWPVLVDSDKEVYDKFFKKKGVPAFAIIDKQGRLSFAQVGWNPAFLSTFQFELNAAIDGN